MTVRKEERFIVHVDADHIIGHLKRNSKLGQFRIEEVDPDSKTATLKNQINGWSLGEEIHIALENGDNDDETKVFVESKSLLKTIIFDYGVNKKNVAKVRDLIKQMSEDERDYVEGPSYAAYEAKEKFQEAKEQALMRGVTKYTIRREMRAERKAARKDK